MKKHYKVKQCLAHIRKARPDIDKELLIRIEYFLCMFNRGKVASSVEIPDYDLTLADIIEMFDLKQFEYMSSFNRWVSVLKQKNGFYEIILLRTGETYIVDHNPEQSTGVLVRGGNVVEFYTKQNKSCHIRDGKYGLSFYGWEITQAAVKQYRSSQILAGSRSQSTVQGPPGIMQFINRVLN